MWRPRPRPSTAHHEPDGYENDFILSKYTSIPHGKVTSTSPDGRFSVHFGGGTIGRIGETELSLGTLVERAFNLVRRPLDVRNELVTHVRIPCESLVGDLFAHRSIHGLESIRASMHATLSGPLPLDEDLREVVRLPIKCDPVAIEDFERAMQLPRVARYGEIIRGSPAALGRDANEFHLFRVTLDYPPMPSTLPCAGVSLRIRLPTDHGDALPRPATNGRFHRFPAGLRRRHGTTDRAPIKRPC